MKLRTILTLIPGSQIVSIIVDGAVLFDKWEAININSHLFQKDLEYPVIRIETEKENLKIYCVKD